MTETLMRKQVEPIEEQLVEIPLIATVSLMEQQNELQAAFGLFSTEELKQLGYETTDGERNSSTEATTRTLGGIGMLMVVAQEFEREAELSVAETIVQPDTHHTKLDEVIDGTLYIHHTK